MKEKVSMGGPGPKLPQPKPVTIHVEKSALLVLDISERCIDSKLACHQLAQVMKPFLDHARGVGLPIIYSISARLKGTPEGHVYNLLKRRPAEPVIYADGFNKFAGGELQGFLKLYGVDTLIITGYRSNISVLHTAVKATRELKYHVVIPMDGIATNTEYEQEYTLYHFTVLPAQAAKRFTFTTLEMIRFQ